MAAATVDADRYVRAVRWPAGRTDGQFRGRPHESGRRAGGLSEPDPIDKDIEDGGFYENAVLVQAAELAASSETALHVLGLMSPGGIHSHEDQIMAALELARQRGVRKLYLHAFLDGRDTPPRSALASLQRADAFFQRHGIGRVASLCGRFYAMDRDNRWDRVQSAYRLLTEAKRLIPAPAPAPDWKRPISGMRTMNLCRPR